MMIENICKKFSHRNKRQRDYSNLVYGITVAMKKKLFSPNHLSLKNCTKFFTPVALLISFVYLANDVLCACCTSYFICLPDQWCALRLLHFLFHLFTWPMMYFAFWIAALAQSTLVPREQKPCLSGGDTCPVQDIMYRGNTCQTRNYSTEIRAKHGTIAWKHAQTRCACPGNMCKTRQVSRKM